ncbi:uncharacterized protein LOC105276228 isoform X2 [Ooceraea biroi]|uniref:uncharacterized protein LOC105276228 isoform X2 n=1 Tax=Ooceraea biroi TaxID=2015173 RepID=UPI0005BC87E4|nr:uncharacterized protein LOC105276228 isoform X2 [Ooceraea biroi]XP_011331992.1 uncharacterized protein LOC105276228 isoform X2 [Ooceraea biroi]
MQTACFYRHLVWAVWCLLQVAAKDYVVLTHNGPVVLGGTITFRADLYRNGERPKGDSFKYMWSDNSLMQHRYEIGRTSNTTTFWSVTYPREGNIPGTYTVWIKVEYLSFIIWSFDTSAVVQFEITEYLNGNITAEQANKTVAGDYISSINETKLMVDIRKDDYEFIMQKATAISTYWFIDCKYYGQTNNFAFVYNFTSPNVTHEIGALVIASYDPPTTTTVSPPTTTIAPVNVTTVAPNSSTANSSEVHVTQPVTTTTLPTTVTSAKPTIKSTTAISATNASKTDVNNMSMPYICSNASLIPPDPNKTYGYFFKKIHVRAPLSNISVEGTNWIQPWDMLSLNVSCKGSGPFSKCLQFHRGKYNVTGNETCDNAEHLRSCNFSIVHYFLEPSVYTILIILNNEVSTQIYPLTINIYKVTTKPQLSVIVVPVSCSLVAVVLIVFGVAYYIQSRARFTVEVADFDFGQSNPDMEYKTFTERLRDSFNKTVRPGGKRISVRYYGSMNH